MPGGDRTGPWGKGQKTGRGLGFCTGHDFPGYTNPRERPFDGRGRGRGYGRGRGLRFRREEE